MVEIRFEKNAQYAIPGGNVKLIGFVLQSNFVSSLKRPLSKVK